MDKPQLTLPDVETTSTFADIFSYGIVINDLGLLLPTTTTSRIINLDIRLCRLPTAPPWLLGMLSVSGDAVPLFNLANLLELPIDIQPERYVIIGEREQSVAIGITGYPERVRLNVTDQLTSIPPLPEILKPYVHSVYRQERIWINWNFEAFFMAQGQRIAHSKFIQ